MRAGLVMVVVACVAMDRGQEMGDTAAIRLRTAGVDVKFVAAKGTRQVSSTPSS
jgi:hypothetical protein